ncbi:hypothetical protein [Pseudoprimorskyibacter insulae]|uniref:Porin domain-containing protein n=1 Tax=Pseudoprimorskyibacter insulae TaxID=1695997 RepID=A0A2R8AZ95_9RHOB|nr:hypothetical protein [Pseudoprimorskyibacter insulae]SPF81297.1 hypothetical protein PRI8871_03119 [Pseudoprimorskyibacter insulae]
MWKSILSSAAIACIAATSASAQDVSGSVSFGIARNAQQSNNSKRIVAQVAFPMTDRLDLQVDVGVGKYEDTFSTAPYAALHLGYAVSETFKVGAFLAGDDIRPGNYFYYGIEAAYDSGPLSADLFVSGIDVIKSSASGLRYGVDLSYAINANYSVLAGAAGQSLKGDNRTYGYIGAAYTFDNGIRFAATAGKTDKGATIGGVQLTLPFGGGAAFTSRDTRSLFPAYEKP